MELFLNFELDGSQQSPLRFHEIFFYFLGGLVPLHNACSYGHFEVTELLIRHGANVEAMDLWQFSPLHEAASKSRTEVCSLLLSHGADPMALNCHGKSAIGNYFT